MYHLAYNISMVWELCFLAIIDIFLNTLYGVSE